MAYYLLQPGGAALGRGWRRGPGARPQPQPQPHLVLLVGCGTDPLGSCPPGTKPERPLNLCWAFRIGGQHTDWPSSPPPLPFPARHMPFNHGGPPLRHPWAPMGKGKSASKMLKLFLVTQLLSHKPCGRVCVCVAGAHQFMSAESTSEMPPSRPSFALCGSGAGRVQTGRAAPARGFGSGTRVNRDETGQEEERA